MFVDNQREGQQDPLENVGPSREIGKFRILTSLGQGAAGDVFLATPLQEQENYNVGQFYAIKIYNGAILKEPNQLERIKREAEVGKKIISDYVVKIHEVRYLDRDVGVYTQKTPYQVMEYVDGQTLSDWIQMHHPISERLLVRIFQAILFGLQEIHNIGTLHRDIKPQNIMITSDFHAKIMDLGVIYIAGEPRITPGTLSAKRPGTLAYNSPEALDSKFEKMSDKSDIHSVGAVLYFLLSGCGAVDKIIKNVDKDKKIAKAMQAVLDGLANYFDFNTDSQVKQRLYDFSKKMVARNPSDRPRDCNEIIKDIESIEPQVQGPEPINAYIACSLTGLDIDSREAIAFVSHTIAKVCKDFEIYVHEPRKITDPILHADVLPEPVYRTDRQRVVGSRLIIVLATKPSTGVGQEIEIAATHGVPIILVAREKTSISRMVLGSPANFLTEPLYYNSPESLEDLIRESLSRNIDKIRDWNNQLNLPAPIQYGHVLQSLRKKKDFSVEEAAQKIGISHKALRLYEDSHQLFANIGFHTLQRILTIYGNSLEVFFQSFTGSVEYNHGIPDLVNWKRLNFLAKKYGWSAEKIVKKWERRLSYEAAKGGTSKFSDEFWLEDENFNKDKKSTEKDSSKKRSKKDDREQQQGNLDFQQ